MIRYITRKNLDEIKYNQCISSSLNSRIYGTSNYLDIVTKNWDALVLNDYEGVMPLPWRSKYLIKYIYPPCWTQQLGIFSQYELDAKQIEYFLESIPNKFIKTSIKFNSKCYKKEFLQKSNYTLALKNEYQEIKANYRKDRRYRANQFLKTGLKIVEEIDANNLIDLFKSEYYEKVNLKELDFDSLRLISKSKFLKPLILKVYNFKNDIISGAIFVRDANRIYYIFSASNKEGRSVNANTGVLDFLIRNYSKSDLTLDFEGSMIPAIKSYFKSFGSTEEKYYFFENNKLKRLK